MTHTNDSFESIYKERLKQKRLVEQFINNIKPGECPLFKSVCKIGRFVEFTIPSKSDKQIKETDIYGK